MIIKLSHDKLKEIMNKEKRVDLYLSIEFKQLFELLKYKGLLIEYEYKSLEQKADSTSWIVKKDVHSKNPNSLSNELSLYVGYSLNEYQKYRNRLKDFEHFGMTDVEMEIESTLISHFKTIEDRFKEFDKYFLENIGDVEIIDIQKIITAGKELEELETSI